MFFGMEGSGVFRKVLYYFFVVLVSVGDVVLLFECLVGFD